MDTAVWVGLVASPFLFTAVIYFVHRRDEEITKKFERLESEVFQTTIRIDKSISEVNHKVTLVIDEEAQLKLLKNLNGTQLSLRMLWDQVMREKARLDELRNFSNSHEINMQKFLQVSKNLWHHIERIKKHLDIR